MIETYFHAGVIDGKHLEIWVRTTEYGTFAILTYDDRPFSMIEINL